MESKRQSHQQVGDERGFQILAQPSKRRREDSQQAETCVIGNLRSPLHIWTDIVPCVTGLVQGLVREELERRLFPRPTINQTGTTGAKFLQLVFKNELPATIFTLSKIKAKNDKPVEIALCDIRSKSIITEGPLSSMKIDICVLNGEFSSNGSEDWTTDEFKANILRPRDNKGKLLKGDTVITLKNGVGYITKILFTDNSSWTRSRRFRLGAKVVESNSNEPNIREGRSKPFIVKDSRGELNQKHYPPSLNDEIWRLEKISKDGKIHKRLSMHGINTVKDLLQLHETNPSLLGEKFGKTSRRLQEAIIEHAETCVVKLTFAEQNYRSQNTLNSDEKRLERLKKQHAYRNVKDLIPVDKTNVHSLPSPLASPQSAGQCSAPDLQALDLSTAQQDQQEKRQDFSQPSTSTLHMDEAAHNNQVGFAELLSGMCMEGNGLSLLGSHVPTVVPDVYSPLNDFSEIQFVNDIPFSYTGMGAKI